MVLILILTLIESYHHFHRSRYRRHSYQGGDNALTTKKVPRHLRVHHFTYISRLSSPRLKAQFASRLRRDPHVSPGGNVFRSMGIRRLPGGMDFRYQQLLCRDKITPIGLDMYLRFLPSKPQTKDIRPIHYLHGDTHGYGFSLPPAICSA
jgi:hypothetical protein